MKTKLFTILKKQLLPTLLLFGTLNYEAQSGLSNMSFEAWSVNALGNAPTGWLGFNVSHQTTGAQQGGSYVRISNTTNEQGVLMLGTPTTFSVIKGGAPCTQNLVSLTGFYKTSGMVSGDVVGLTSYTSKLGTINALATFTQNTNIASWTSFSMLFIALNPGPIDSLFIIASSSNLGGGGNNSISAVLDVDNFALAIPAGIDEKSLGTAFLVYPNPASSELNIISKEEKAVSIIITDLNGKRIDELFLDAEKIKVDLQNYERGIYFYSILDREKTTLLTNKFVVSH